MMKQLFTIIALFFLSVSSFSQQVTVDETFNSTDQGNWLGDGPNRNVYDCAAQSDGKLIIAGTFTAYNDVPRSYVARINADGSVDESFNPTLNSTVRSLAIQSDGKIILAGEFTEVNGLFYDYLVRLNSDGSIDETFTLTNNLGVPSVVALQSDGKILLGGNPVNGFTAGIVRISSTGVPESGFSSNVGVGTDMEVSTILPLSNGKILIGGNFTTFNGISRKYIAQLNSDGSLDTGFNPGTGFNANVRSISVQSDGKYIVGGGFSTYNGSPCTKLIRLNSDATIDNSLVLDVDFNYSYIYSTMVMSDGKIFIGCQFDEGGTSQFGLVKLFSNGSRDDNFTLVPILNLIPTNFCITASGKVAIGSGYTGVGLVANNLVVVNEDGSVDETFNPVNGLNQSVYDMKFKSDGKILVSGGFSSFQGNRRNGIVQLNEDGTIDASFNPGRGANDIIYSVFPLSTGKCLIGGSFTGYNGDFIFKLARINSNGTLDKTFPSSGTGANNTVRIITTLPDGKILIGGDFTLYNNYSHQRIARLNSDGTLDHTFNANADNTVLSFVVQPDGKIVLGGNFTTVNGVGRKHLARLNADGTLDNTFVPETDDNFYISKIILQSDGRILALVNQSPMRVMRFNSEGSVDNTFSSSANANNYLHSMALTSDGKIVVVGSFSSYNGHAGITMLNSDGTRASSFNPGTGSSSAVRSVLIQQDGKIIIGGDFTSFNGIGKNRILRLKESITNETSDSQEWNQLLYAYPNPGNGKLSVDFGKQTSAEVTICNAQGEVVETVDFKNSDKLNLELNGPHGLYLIVVKIGNQNYTLKVVKE